LFDTSSATTQAISSVEMRRPNRTSGPARLLDGPGGIEPAEVSDESVMRLWLLSPPLLAD